MRIAFVPMLIVAMAASAPGRAQDPRGSVDQIAPAQPRSDAPIAPGQIATRSRELISPTRSEAPSPDAPAQLSSERESSPAAPQLNPERGPGPAPTQLYTGGRTAQPSEALSRPSEGRTGTVLRVEGDDRCDSARNPQAARDPDCRRVIETRSAEFARPAPTALSPEQRLMVDQRLRERPANARTAARDLADSGEDADSAQAQNVASIVLRGDPARSGEDGPASPLDGLSEEAAALVNAIVQGATSTPPQSR